MVVGYSERDDGYRRIMSATMDIVASCEMWKCSTTPHQLFPLAVHCSCTVTVLFPSRPMGNKFVSLSVHVSVEQTKGGGIFAAQMRLGPALHPSLHHAVQLKAKHAEGLRLPEAAMRQQFWGMSLLYHVTHFLWLVVPTMPFPRPAINDITAAGTVLCSKNFAALVQDYEGKDPNTPRRRMPGRCFDAALTVALLGRPWGWGFAANARQVTMVHNVSGVEVEWTIGAAVAKASEFAEASAAEAAALHVAWTSDVFLLLPCVVLLPAALYLAYSYRRLGLQCPSSPRIERMSPP